jgi:hypothetical protein
MFRKEADGQVTVFVMQGDQTLTFGCNTYVGGLMAHQFAPLFNFHQLDGLEVNSLQELRELAYHHMANRTNEENMADHLFFGTVPPDFTDSANISMVFNGLYWSAMDNLANAD